MAHPDTSDTIGCPGSSGGTPGPLAHGTDGGYRVRMADWEDVRGIASGLPGVVEGTTFGSMSWKVGGKLLVWERPLRAKDLAELGLERQAEAVLGAAVEDESTKRALIEEDGGIFFTTEHFEGYAAILVRLERIPLPRLDELIDDAWFVRAPARLRRERGQAAESE